jgi:hypothetical protein
MIVEVEDRRPETEARGGRNVKPAVPKSSVVPADDSRVDEMSESSFPASDPPSAWTWEVKSPTNTANLPEQR